MMTTLKHALGRPCYCGEPNGDGIVSDCHNCIGIWLGGRARIKARSKGIEKLWGVHDPKKVAKRVKKRRKKAKK